MKPDGEEKGHLLEVGKWELDMKKGIQAGKIEQPDSLFPHEPVLDHVASGRISRALHQDSDGYSQDRQIRSQDHLFECIKASDIIRDAEIEEEINHKSLAELGETLLREKGEKRGDKHNHAVTQDREIKGLLQFPVGHTGAKGVFPVDNQEDAKGKHAQFGEKGAENIREGFAAEQENEKKYHNQSGDILDHALFPLPGCAL